VTKERLELANPGLAILSAGEEGIARYARPFAAPGLGGLVEFADRLLGVDPEGNRYVASEPELEAHPASAAFGPAFAQSQLQVGWCAGPNSRLNGLEYHKSPEILVAVTDLALLVGRIEDIGPELSYDSSRLECLFLRAGEAVALLPRTLHFSPCKVSDAGFKSLIVLPRGTNTPLSAEELAARPAEGEGRLLFMRNKWQLAHPERRVLVERGAHPGIVGENVEVRY
jgi:hypothetical protein